MKNANRPLGALEKAFWLLDQTNHVHFVLAAEIIGTKTIVAWRDAIEAIKLRHPLMSVYIRGNGYKDPAFQYVPASLIPFRVILGDAQTKWETEIERELSVPFDGGQAPLFRAVLIQQKSRCVFIMAVHHSVSDGISLTYVFQDIFNALAGKIAEHLPVPLSTDELLGFKETDSKFKNLFKKLKDQGNVEINFGKTEEETPRVTRLALTVDLTQILAERAKQERTTVHGALSAAVVFAGRKIRQEWNDKPVRIVNPVSTRKALSVGVDSGLYITSKIITFQPYTNNTFWDMARYATEQLKGVGERQDLIFTTAVLREKVFGDIEIKELLDQLQKGVAREVMLSNLGRIPMKTNYGELQLEAIWGPLALSGYKGDQTIGVSTLNGSLRLLHASRIPLESLLILMEKELKIACS